MLGACALFAAYAIVAGLQQRSLLHRVDTSPGSVTLGQVQADGDRTDMVNTVSTILVVTTGLAFVVWFFQAYRNVPALGRPRRYAAGWAIGWWFVPFACLWCPASVARDINASIDDEYSRDWEITRWVLNAWWGAWLLMLVLGATANGENGSVHTLHDALSANALYLARDVAAVVAAVLAGALVVRLTRRTRIVTAVPQVV